MSGWAGDGFLDSIPTVHSLSLTVTHCHSLTQPPSQCHPQIVPTPAAHGQVSAHHPPTHSQWPAATLSLLSLSVTDRQSVSQSVSQSKAVTSDQQQDDNATTQHHTTTFMMTTMTIRRRHHYFLRSCCALLCCVVFCCVVVCWTAWSHSLIHLVLCGVAVCVVVFGSGFRSYRASVTAIVTDEKVRLGCVLVVFLWCWTELDTVVPA